MRLDNVLFRGGFLPTIPSARQFIVHGHILVNNKKITIPSYSCSPNDIITVNKNMKSYLFIQDFLNRVKKSKSIPAYLNVSQKDVEITILDHFQYLETGLNLNELLIIEYYSRS